MDRTAPDGIGNAYYGCLVVRQGENDKGISEGRRELASLIIGSIFS